jgi:hypothetical protein
LHEWRRDDLPGALRPPRRTPEHLPRGQGCNRSVHSQRSSSSASATSTDGRAHPAPRAAWRRTAGSCSSAATSPSHCAELRCARRAVLVLHLSLWLPSCPSLPAHPGAGCPTAGVRQTIDNKVVDDDSRGACGCENLLFGETFAWESSAAQSHLRALREARLDGLGNRRPLMR